jgi:hypothetical protein
MMKIEGRRLSQSISTTIQILSKSNIILQVIEAGAVSYTQNTTAAAAAPGIF